MSLGECYRTVRIRALRYWRIATRRCVLCGGPLNHHVSHVSASPIRRACHWCNKRVRFGNIYGVDGETLRSSLLTH